MHMTCVRMSASAALAKIQPTTHTLRHDRGGEGGYPAYLRQGRIGVWFYPRMRSQTFLGKL